MQNMDDFIGHQKLGYNPVNRLDNTIIREKKAHLYYLPTMMHTC